MKLQAGLWQQQTLKLTMTQELTQAIALLQYNTQELSEFLENKALENPLLQIESGNVQAMDPRFDRTKPARKKLEKDKQHWIEQIGKIEPYLDEHIKSQLDFKLIQSIANGEKVFDYLIECLDENGYLRVEMSEVATRFRISDEAVDKAINLLQGVEPAGIGARNLQECILLQLKRKQPRNDLAEEIIEKYFDSFADKKWRDISKELGVKMSEIQEVFDFIQTLNPRPAASFQHEKSAYIVPDVIIDWDGESFSVSVFDEALPKISFNNDYYKRFSANKDKQVKRFLQDNQQDYFWIMRSIEQRKETLTKVSLKIVEKQQEFFIKGPAYLKPMIMKEIADELDIHESTVSRAVREKYAQTPFGTLELRSFFSSTIKTTSDENTSSKQVKTIISKLIDGENKQKPLSDQELVQLLKDQEGMVVSRRTIAKYRDQLGIPSSSKRKRYD
ncbi:RNA polymerase factor sigma-54 [Bacillus sp. DTU_2020_1000418_1_SI_GHA_SEK_038]|uniref:RNA polymerase factor sigma-54 n=1 Tax=Bacillus sp. DTU_2020_1000418_1_SI_GHA_SEK_038 TaxID=3077585 RepID=UPI0028ECDA1A|nr:RNA polymerase factor sigma-54 [Bacillus sp. DTU_2020_1000418_1_SI_GHA_SEK_038]WNS75015.1 RNA polymerase factor sigma-54 [Bacillus sp. DTU_2020_1000418_1_SI_GHA_SEK_038]